MKINSNFWTNAAGVFFGLISGVAMTAYAIGSKETTIIQDIKSNTEDIREIKTSINSQLNQICISLNDLKVDVGVLKAIVTRIENKK